MLYIWGQLIRKIISEMESDAWLHTLSTNLNWGPILVLEIRYDKKVGLSGYIAKTLYEPKQGM